MSKPDVYRRLVQDYFEYHYDADLYVFLAGAIQKVRCKGVHPEDCAQLLHGALEAFVRQFPKRKE